jgi:hypothetical protein
MENLILLKNVLIITFYPQIFESLKLVFKNSGLKKINYDENLSFDFFESVDGFTLVLFCQKKVFKKINFDEFLKTHFKFHVLIEYGLAFALDSRLQEGDFLFGGDFNLNLNLDKIPNFPDFVVLQNVRVFKGKVLEVETDAFLDLEEIKKQYKNYLAIKEKNLFNLNFKNFFSFNFITYQNLLNLDFLKDKSYQRYFYQGSVVLKNVLI